MMSCFQLVMEYCLGSASDLLEGEKQTVVFTLLNDMWIFEWVHIVLVVFLQFIKNLYKKLRLLPSHMVLCRGWPTFIPIIWSTGEWGPQSTVYFILWYLSILGSNCKHYISPLIHMLWCSLSLSGMWKLATSCWLSLAKSNWQILALPPLPHLPTLLWERHIGKWNLYEVKV